VSKELCKAAVNFLRTLAFSFVVWNNLKNTFRIDVLVYLGQFRQGKDDFCNEECLF
jgi:hypothetical protein